MADGIDTALVAIGLGATRTIPIVWLLPAFGAHHVPSQLRVGLGVALALVAYPVLATSAAGVADAGPVVLALLIAREIVVGVAVGLGASLFFRAAEGAGRIADVLRGANMAEVLSPAVEERTSPLGDLGLLLSVVIFLELGGLGIMSVALAKSYEAVPIASLPSAGGLRSAAEILTVATGRLIEAALGLAAPVVVSLLLVDVALGAVARVAPQIPVAQAAMPLKALAGVGAFLLGLGVLEVTLARDLPGWRSLVERLFAAFG